MQKTKRYATALAVGALLALSACGGGGNVAQSGGGGAPIERDAGQARPAASDSELAVAESGATEDWAAQQDFDRKIVKTAELGIRAEDVRGSAARAQEVAAQFGGSVLSSQIVRGDGTVYADLVLLVPSPEFEKALEELRGLGKEVTTDTVRGEDVTEEFVDLESRERNLLAAEQSLLELYGRAQSVNDALAIERELANIRGQIEQVQGRIQYLEERAPRRHRRPGTRAASSSSLGTPRWASSRRSRPLLSRPSSSAGGSAPCSWRG